MKILTGSTYPHRSTLKRLGCEYDPINGWWVCPDEIELPSLWGVNVHTPRKMSWQELIDAIFGKYRYIAILEIQRRLCHALNIEHKRGEVYISCVAKLHRDEDGSWVATLAKQPVDSSAQKEFVSQWLAEGNVISQ